MDNLSNCEAEYVALHETSRITNILEELEIHSEEIINYCDNYGANEIAKDPSSILLDEQGI